MAGAARDRVGRLAGAQLRQVFGVEIVGHFDHQARLVLDGVGIGGEVVAPGLGVSGVAEFALDAEIALVLMHDFDDFVAGDVFGKSLDVGWVGARAPGWSRGLGRGSRSVLSQGNMGR